MTRDHLALLLALTILSACRQTETNASPVADDTSSNQSKGSGEAEIPAPDLPGDEQIASALDGEAEESISHPPDGVIVEPDLLRTVVRNSRCRFLSGSRSRATCTFESTRSTPDRSHAEAVEWVSQSGNWGISTRTFAYRRFSYNKAAQGTFWVVLPR